MKTARDQSESRPVSMRAPKILVDALERMAQHDDVSISKLLTRLVRKEARRRKFLVEE